MGKRHSPVLETVRFAALVAVAAWLLTAASDRSTYPWQWYRVPAYLIRWESGGLAAGPLLTGLWVTLKITAMSFLLAFSVGLTTALLRLSGSPAAILLARIYLETIRNTPLLVQLFFGYFVVAPILGLGSTASAVITLSLFEGAYASEIFRAGIVSIGREQWEAAFSMGMNRMQTYRRVILPQAIRRILPPLTGQGVSLIKDSALVSTIAIYDLTLQGQAVIADTFLTFEIWFTVAALYLTLTLTLSLTVRQMEKRLAAGSG